MVLLKEPEQRDLLRNAPDPALLFESWIDECRAITLADPERGLGLTARLHELEKVIQNARLSARVRSAQCHALSYSGKMKQALAMSEQAIEAAEAAGDDAAIAEACLTSVQSHNVLGLRTEALELAMRAGEVFERLGDFNRSATAIMLAGVVLRMLDRPTEALTEFESAMQKPGLNPSLLAQLASNRAEALLDLGMFEEAKLSFESALAGFASCDQDFGVAIVEGNLADLASRRGMLHEALGLFLSASSRFKDASDEEEAARLEAEAAELFLAIGDHREALTRLPHAIEVLAEAGMQTELTRARMALGVALGKSGDLEEACAELVSARDESVRHDQPRSASRAEALRGGVLLSHDVYAEAVAVLGDALAFDPHEPAQARIKLDLGRALLACGHAEEAEAELDEASDLIHRLGLADLDAELFAARAGLHRVAGRYDKAHAMLRLVFDAVEQRRGVFAGDRLRAATIGGRSGVFDEAMRLAIATDDARFALEVSERGNARSLVESIADSGHKDSDELAKLESDVVATLSMIESARDDGKDESAINVLRASLRSQQEKVASFELQLSHGEHGVDTRFTFDVDAVLGSVPEGSAAIVVMIAGQELVSVRVAGGKASLSCCGIGYKSAKSLCRSLLTDIDRALVRLTIGREVSASLDDRIHEGLGRLGEGIFGQHRSLLEDADRVVVVLPRELSALPIAALEINGQAMVEMCTPTLAPSLAWAVQAADQDTSGREGLVVAGVPDKRAPFIADEIEAIAEAVSCKALVGAGASLSRLGEAASCAQTIHLSCHAEYTPEDPMGSRLLLGEGWVSARRILDLDITGTSVVLGGCETGIIDGAYSGEHFGLVRAFLQAGAGCVIASKWRLSDTYAREALASLHAGKALGSGRLPARLARIQANSSRNREHPALWGGLFAVGSWS